MYCFLKYFVAFIYVSLDQTLTSDSTCILFVPPISNVRRSARLMRPKGTESLGQLRLTPQQSSKANFTTRILLETCVGY